MHGRLYPAVLELNSCIGNECDAETGLDYFGARYFSGAQGRFTSPDEPFADQDPADPQSWNLYSYVRNNPLIFTDPTGNDCVYVNNSGNGIDRIDNQNTSKACGKTGGYWVDGAVTHARFAHGSLTLTGTTNGNDTTSASYGLGPDPGLLALRRGTQLAEPGVNLAGQGLMLFGSIVAPLPMALANCGAGECDNTDIAMAMIPGSGGGKTGRKVGEKAYQSAKEAVDLLRRVLKRLEQTPNKTPATYKAIRIVEGRLDDALERLVKSEPHGKRGKATDDKEHVMLFTIILEFEGTSSVSQLSARNVSEAYRSWFEGLKDPSRYGLDAGQAERLASALSFDGLRTPTPLDSVENVWCTVAHAGEKPALLNFVITVSGYGS